jgi:hypothetical protein
VRPLVIAFLLGAVATGIVAGAAAAALVIVADAAGWGSFRAAAGPVLVLAFERSGGVTRSSFGHGLALIALAGGCLNAAGAWVLRRRVDLH